MGKGRTQGRSGARPLIHGRFEVIHELGQGAGGVVYLVFDRLRRGKAVLKHLWPSPEEERGAAQAQLRASFKALTLLQHQSLPRLLDWGVDESGRAFYTKAFVEGEPGDRSVGRLSAPEVAQAAQQLLEVLGLLHRGGYCHGDLKPDNMLLAREGSTTRVHLIDFGLIFELNAGPRALRGTPLYLAPELLRGAAPGVEGDLYALGATLYHLLYGRAPFEVEETGASEIRDAVLLDRILHEQPQHPPEGWEAPDEAQARAALEALAPLIEGLMSPRPERRQEAARRSQEVLAPWAPPAGEGGFGPFVGRVAEQAEVLGWLSDNFEATAGVAPLMMLQGPAGSGRTRLTGVVAAELRDQGVVLLEHTCGGGDTDLVLDELARQLLIAAPEALGEELGDLLGELSLGGGGAGGGEEARRRRLLRHLMEAGRRRPLAVVVRGLEPEHRAWRSVVALTNHLEADRTRPTPARLAVLALCDQAPGEVLDADGRATLARAGRVMALGPLGIDEVEAFLAGALPPAARPRDPNEVWRLTGGMPLRLVEFSRALLEASRRGERPEGRTLVQAADLEGSLKRRMERQGTTARAALMALALVGAPISLERLRGLLIEHTPTPGLLQALMEEGLVVSVGGGAAVRYQLSSRAVALAVTDQRWEDVPPASTLTARQAEALRALWRQHPEAIEAIEVLDWGWKAGRADAVFEDGLEIGRAYRAQQRHALATRALELTLAAGAGLPEDPERMEAVRFEALGVSMEQDAPTRAEAMALALLESWRQRTDIGLDGLDQMLDAPALDDERWEPLLARLPGAAPPQPPPARWSLVAQTLGQWTLARIQRADREGALALAQAAAPLLERIQSPEAWTSLLRALAQGLWRTRHRGRVLEAVERLVDDGSHFEALSPAQRAQLLNLQGAMLETDGRVDQALEVYEAAMLTGRRRGQSSPGVAMAIANLSRLLTLHGELAVARHYIERGLALAERHGYLASLQALLRTQAAVHHRLGEPYDGLMSIEAAYRAALSGGRQDMVARSSVSLLHHYGQFGLEEHAGDLYERMLGAPTWQGRWEPHLQYALALMSWGQVERARGLMNQVRDTFDADQLGTDGRGLLHLLEAEAAQLERRWTSVVLEAGQCLAVIRQRPDAALRAAALRLLTEGHLEQGNLGEAGRRCDELLEVIKEHDLGSERPSALHLQARLMQANRRTEQAIRLFSQARQQLEARLEEMPEGYQENYLRDRRRQAILQDAAAYEGVDRNRLLEGLEQILQIAQHLYRVGGGADELLDEALDRMIGFTGAERGIIFRLSPHDPERSLADTEEISVLTEDWGPTPGRAWEVRLACARGFQSHLDQRRSRASNTVIKRVLREGQPVFTADAAEDLRFSQSRSINNLGMRSVLAFALREGQQINGVAYLDSTHHNQFNPEDSRLLGLLGDQLGPVVERALRREQARSASVHFPRIIGRSEKMVEVLSRAARVAAANVDVLILGHTGTGKDLLARGIHDASSRARAPFVAVNCAAISKGVAESIFFGHRKGSFTGAVADRKGLFRDADGGTLFLDEVGDMPPEQQATLLRALQDKAIMPVGDSHEIPVDVRVIAATRWDLGRLVQEGRFREDLYYRLETITLRLPGLEERAEDIPELVHFLFNLFLEQYGISLLPPSPEVVEVLQRSSWPGNIRQLRNVLQQAMIMCEGDALTPEAIRRTLRDDAAGVTPRPMPQRQGAAPEAPSWASPAGWPAPWGNAWPVPWPSPPFAPAPAWAPQPDLQAAPWPAAPPRGRAAPTTPHQPSSRPAPSPPMDEAYTDMLGETARLRYELALEALEAAGGNKTKAAELMGISRTSFYRILWRAQDDREDREP